MQAAASAALARLQPVPEYVPRSLLQHGGGKLERQVRLLCTDVWPTLFQVLSLQRREACQVWALPKEQAIALLPPETGLAQTIQHFYEAIVVYYTGEQSVQQALTAIQTGVAFLSAVKAWWEQAEFS